MLCQMIKHVYISPHSVVHNVHCTVNYVSPHLSFHDTQLGQTRRPKTVTDQHLKCSHQSPYINMKRTNDCSSQVWKQKLKMLRKLKRKQLVAVVFQLENGTYRTVLVAYNIKIMKYLYSFDAT